MTNATMTKKEAATGETVAALESAATGELRNIPFNRLHLSALNVRKVRNPDTIPALASTILAAGGLINALTVVPEKRKGGKGETFGVVAGGRRLAAMQYLVERKQMAADLPVPCRIIGIVKGVSVSLTENVSQEPMHPADQLEAFKKMVDEGKTAGQIAADFGLSTLTVERRLKLAKLALEFMELFRKGEIEAKQLQALTLTDDHEEQRRVWESLPPYSRSPHHIQQLLTQNEIRGDAPTALFVGVQAYQAAGGAVRSDLFAGEDGSFYFQDGALLNKLALEKLEAEARAIRDEGWKWVEARLTFPYDERSVFGQLEPCRFEPTDEEKAAMERVQADLDSLRACLEELERLDDDLLTAEQVAEYHSLTDQSEALIDMLASMKKALRDWEPKQRAISGVVLSIGHQGELVLNRGLVKAEDRKAAQQAAGPVGVAGGSMAKTPKERPEFSSTLCADLAAHCTAAVGAALTQQPKVALAALLMTFVLDAGEPWRQSPVKMRFTDNAHRIGNQAKEYAGSRAQLAFEQAAGAVQALPKPVPALFAALLALELDELAKLLAVFVGHSYDVFSTQAARSEIGVDMAQLIETALNVDMADWWAPTAERFLNRVPKSKLMEAVGEACGPEAARPLEKMKKAEAASVAATLLEGRRWLPSTLRPYPPADDEAEEAVSADADEEDAD